MAKVLLGIELAVSFAPFLGYLLYGLFILPGQIIFLLVDPAEFFTYGWPILALLVGGLAGTLSLHNVLSHLFDLEVKSRDARLIWVGLVAGLVALVSSVFIVAPNVRTIAILPVLATFHIIFLDRKFLFYLGDGAGKGNEPNA